MASKKTSIWINTSTIKNHFDYRVLYKAMIEPHVYVNMQRRQIMQHVPSTFLSFHQYPNGAQQRQRKIRTTLSVSILFLSFDYLCLLILNVLCDFSPFLRSLKYHLPRHQLFSFIILTFVSRDLRTKTRKTKKLKYFLSKVCQYFTSYSKIWKNYLKKWNIIIFCRSL